MRERAPEEVSRMRMESVGLDSAAAWSEEPEEECVGCEICGTCFELADELEDVGVPAPDRGARGPGTGPSSSGWAH
jgi:hypothetical protein